MHPASATATGSRCSSWVAPARRSERPGRPRGSRVSRCPSSSSTAAPPTCRLTMSTCCGSVRTSARRRGQPRRRRAPAGRRPRRRRPGRPRLARRRARRAARRRRPAPAGRDPRAPGARPRRRAGAVRPPPAAPGPRRAPAHLAAPRRPRRRRARSAGRRRRCLLLRRAALDSVDGFDPRYPGRLDDLDLADRLARAGWLTVHVPSAVVVLSARPRAPTPAAPRRYLADRAPRPVRGLLRPSVRS